MIGAAILAAALAGSAPSAMGNIIVTVSGKIPLPATAKPLGKSRGQAWAAWPGELAVAAPIDSALRLAYIDEAEFREETAGLTVSQVAEAMLKRSAGNGQYLSDMSDRLAVASGRIGAWINDSAALEIHRDGYYTGRFIYENGQDIEELIQEQNRVRALEKELLARGDCPPSIAENLRKRDSASALAHLEKAAAPLGQPNAHLKRHDSQPRILYAREIFPWLASRVDNHDLVVDKANKGYLIPQTPDEVATHPQTPHAILAFLDPAQSARAVRLLTRAQLDKRIAALVAQGGVSVRDYLAQLLDDRLRMLATIRQCLASAKLELPPGGRAEMEAAYAQILGETHAAAEDLLGPVNPAAGLARLAELRLRIRILGKFSAASGDAGLIAWTQRSAAALGAKP